MSALSNSITQIIYFIAAFLFILGLKRMCSPATGHKGLVWVGSGMLIAVIITYFHHEVKNHYLWMTVALFSGGALAYVSARKARMTEMPKMIALFNGLGGGAAAAITAVALIKPENMPDTVKYLAVAGALIGCISFSGSLVAFAKLQNLIKDSIHFPMQQWANALIIVVAVTFGIAIILNGNQFEVTTLILFFILAVLFGILLVIPMSDSDMPVLISLLNAFTGLAVGFVGYVISNIAMMIAGFLVAAATIKLTLSMCQALNRPLSFIFFGSFDEVNNPVRSANLARERVRELQTNDAAMMMAFSQNVIIVPGYGMAVAQAQHKVWEMSKLLKANGVNVKFAIHPVAGRMPGHMNVLLAEADIPYDSIYDLDEINGEFDSTDVVLLIGANDTTNTSARTDQNSPIFGMPILNVDKAKNIIIIKRGEGAGYSGVDNPLLYLENTGVLFGDAQSVLSEVIRDLKEI